MTNEDADRSLRGRRCLHVFPVVHDAAVGWEHTPELTVLVPRHEGAEFQHRCRIPYGSLALTRINDAEGVFYTLLVTIQIAHHTSRGGESESGPCRQHKLLFDNLLLDHLDYTSTGDLPHVQFKYTLNDYDCGTYLEADKTVYAHGGLRVAVKPRQYYDSGNFANIVIAILDDNDRPFYSLTIESSVQWPQHAMAAVEPHWALTGDLSASAADSASEKRLMATQMRVEESFVDEKYDSDDSDSASDSEDSIDSIDRSRAQLFIHQHADDEPDDFAFTTLDSDDDTDIPISFPLPDTIPVKSDRALTDSELPSDYLTEFVLLQSKRESLVFANERIYVNCDSCSKWRLMPAFISQAGWDSIDTFTVCAMVPDESHSDCGIKEVQETLRVTDIWEADDCCGVCELPARGARRGFVSWFRDDDSAEIGQYRAKWLELAQRTAIGWKLSVHTLHTVPHTPTTTRSHCYISGTESMAEQDLLFTCNGPCLRSFHRACCVWPQFISIEPGTDTDWYCHDCRRGYHFCFICNQKGKLGTSLRKCEAVCGKFYHKACLPSPGRWHSHIQRQVLSVESQFKHWLKANATTKSSTDSNKKSRNGDGSESDYMDDRSNHASDSDDEEPATLFICPAHWCHHCGLSGEGRLLMRCLRCPAAYHLSDECRPRSVHRLTETSFICHSHTSTSTFVSANPIKRKREKIMMQQGRPTLPSWSSQWLKSGYEVERRLGLRSKAGEFCTAPLSLRHQSLYSSIFNYQYPLLPLHLYKDRKLLSLGTIIVDRAGFSTERYIWPVGYKSLTMLHAIDGGFINLLCQIKDNGHSPLFVVQPISTDIDLPSNDHNASKPSEGTKPRFIASHAVSASDLATCWMQALAKIPLWANMGSSKKIFHRQDIDKSVAGADKYAMAAERFGLDDPTVIAMIEAMPLARFAPLYVKHSERQRREQERVDRLAQVLLKDERLARECEEVERQQCELSRRSVMFQQPSSSGSTSAEEQLLLAVSKKETPPRSIVSSPPSSSMQRPPALQRQSPPQPPSSPSSLPLNALLTAYDQRQRRERLPQLPHLSARRPVVPGSAPILSPVVAPPVVTSATVSQSQFRPPAAGVIDLTDEVQEDGAAARASHPAIAGTLPRVEHEESSQAHQPVRVQSPTQPLAPETETMPTGSSYVANKRAKVRHEASHMLDHAAYLQQWNDDVANIRNGRLMHITVLTPPNPNALQLAFSFIGANASLCPTLVVTRPPSYPSKPFGWRIKAVYASNSSAESNNQCYLIAKTINTTLATSLGGSAQWGLFPFVTKYLKVLSDTLRVLGGDNQSRASIIVRPNPPPRLTAVSASASSRQTSSTPAASLSSHSNTSSSASIAPTTELPLSQPAAQIAEYVRGLAVKLLRLEAEIDRDRVAIRGFGDKMLEASTLVEENAINAERSVVEKRARDNIKEKNWLVAEIAKLKREHDIA